MTFTCVGIDFGTSTCCVSYTDLQGTVQVIKDDILGTFTIPSVVSTDGLAGSEAQIYGKNLVSNFKRLIGKNADDPELKSVTNYGLINRDNSMYIVVGDTEVVLEEVLVRMLNKLCALVQQAVQGDWKCVITVPAYFNEEQRNILWSAIKISGIPCIKLLNEPSSACIAYLEDKRYADSFNVMVFDFGAGTLDLSIIQVERNDNGEILCEVCGVYGDNTFGGIDVTNMVAKEYGISLEQAEEYKKTCCDDEFNIKLEQHFGHRIRRCIDEVIAISKTSIDEVVLVGGSSKLKWIRQLFIDHLLVNPILKGNDFEEKAVSMGAALHCHHIARNNKIILLDRLALSLGVNAMNLFCVIIPRNTLIPGSRTRMFTTEEDNQTSVTVDVYQGESKFLENNVKIASFVLSDIPPARKGEPVIYVTIRVDVNGIIEVKAREKRGNKEHELTIKRDNLSEEVVQSIVSKVNKEKEFIYNKVHTVMYRLYMLVEKISFNVLDNCVLDYDDSTKQAVFDDLIIPVISVVSMLKHYQNEYQLPLSMWDKILDLEDEPPILELRQIIDRMERYIKLINDKHFMYLNTTSMLDAYTKQDKGDEL
jgi:molecular chaperone DnaK (HSP70)